MRSKLVVIASAASVLLLAGCGSATATPSPAASSPAATTPAATPSSPAPTAHPSVAPLSTIDGIAVAGAFGAEPTVTFTAPLAIDQTRSKVITPGKGPAVTETSKVDINYSGINGYTTLVFDSSFKRGESAQFPLSGVIAGFKTGLTGKHVGDRVLIAIPGMDGYDAAGGSSDGSILIGDTLVFVVDILDIDYQAPYGIAGQLAAGLPTVSVDASGVPSLTIDTSATPPAQVVTQPIVAGSGTRKVTADDAIYVKYRMYSWKTGKLLVDQYTAQDAGLLSDTIQCWKDGLVKASLGSRILLVCPPASSYPNGNPTPAVEKGDTVVYVVDLQWAEPGA